MRTNKQREEWRVGIKEEKLRTLFVMKTIKLRSSLLVGICVLLTALSNFFALKNSTLKEISKPYFGVYECEQARLGDKNLLADYTSLTLELQKGGVFTLHYCEKNGREGEVLGKYSYDENTQTITFQVAPLKGIKREFSLRKGVLTLSFSILDKQLCLIFKQK